jgi:hypothetical protein
MDYQAGTRSRKEEIVFPLSFSKAIRFFSLVVVFFCMSRAVLAQTTTTNPLIINVEVSATVLVNPGTTPIDPHPSNPPGPVNTNNDTDVAVFKGFSYPGSTVSLLKNGTVVATLPTAADGTFDIRVRSLTPGTYTFGVQAQDKNGLTSKLLSFTVYVSYGVMTSVEGIFLPPTITSDKVEVKKGDPITFYGSAVPNTEVRLSVSKNFEFLKKTKATASGTWMYLYISSELDLGDYSAKARSLTASDTSPYSDILTFRVGDTNRLRAKNNALNGFRKKCDLNNDEKVNLLDFSIMAFWYKRLGFPQKVDLNSDNSINLTDLSILAYCWTG